MQRFLPTRLLAAACLSFATLLAAQSVPLPASKPSAAVPASSLLPATPVTVEPPATPAQRPPHRAEITFTSGTLSVLANNSSLNQILREISRATGITISGGVSDERVFGQYGPGAPAQVLAALLDGTSSNIVFVHAGVSADTQVPAELILTPRLGGPSPPSPNAHTFDDESASQSSERQEIAPAPDPGVVSRPTITPADSRDQTSPNGANQPSPNGTKTPQQIYDQLQQLRQGQQQPNEQSATPQ